MAKLEELEIKATRAEARTDLMASVKSGLGGVTGTVTTQELQRDYDQRIEELRACGEQVRALSQNMRRLAGRKRA